MAAIRFDRLAAATLALTLLVGVASATDLPAGRGGSAGDGEMTRLYAQILRDPTNSELNFRYAELAEARGDDRLALAAYERILVNDPQNPKVRAALQRIRRKLQPNTTHIFAEFGASWESNARRSDTSKDSDAVFLARVSVRDERSLGRMRWRTIGTLIGDVYADNGDLSYGYAGLLFGPVIDITPTIAMHAAIGGGASYFDHRMFYSEAVAALTFESYLEGAFSMVRVRGGYREYNDFFPADHGYYADITGKFSFPNVMGPADVFIFSPWARWSGIEGVGGSTLVPSEQVEPGKYVEYGARVEYFRRLVEWLSVGWNVAVSERRYKETTDIFFGPVKRRDLFVVPGVTAVVHHVMGYQTDMRLDYRFEHNDSNLAQRDFENHVGTITFVSRR